MFVTKVFLAAVFFSLQINLDYMPITIHNVTSVDIIQQIYEPRPVVPQEEISDLAFSQNSKLLGFVVSQAAWIDGEVHISPLTAIDSSEILSVGTSIGFADEWFFIGKESGRVEQYKLPDMESGWSIDVVDGGDIETIATNINQDKIAVVSTTEMRGDYIFSLLDFEGKIIFQILTGQVGRGYSTAFHPLSDQVAFAILEDYRENLAIPRIENRGWLSTVQLWDISEQSLLSLCNNYRGHLSYASDIVFTADGKHLIYAADDGIRIWDLRDCRQFEDAWSVLEPINEEEFLTTLAIHPTEPILVSAYQSVERGRGIIRFWNVETGEMLHEITDYGDGEYNAITALAFSPDGTLLASGGADGTVRLWGIPAGGD